MTTTVLSPSGRADLAGGAVQQRRRGDGDQRRRSDGFHTRVSPHTSAIAVFHAHTAHGEVERGDHPDDPERVPGLHQPVPGPLRGHRAARRAGATGPTAKSQMSIISWTSPRASETDLADLDADQVGEVLLVLGQQLAEALDQPPRTGAGTVRHCRNAACARSIACSTSAVPATGTVATASPVTGLTTSIRPVPGSVSGSAPQRRRAVGARAPAARRSGSGRASRSSGLLGWSSEGCSSE